MTDINAVAEDRMVADVPDCETFSMSVPSRISSSFCALDSEIDTPSSIAMFLTACTKTLERSQTLLTCSTNFLPQEVADFDRGSGLLNDAVDREMGIYKTHFVAETLRDADDEVVNE